MNHDESGSAGLPGLLTDVAELAPTDLGTDLSEVRRLGRRRIRARRTATACAGVATAVAVVAGAAGAGGLLPGTGGAMQTGADVPVVLPVDPSVTLPGDATSLAPGKTLSPERVPGAEAPPPDVDVQRKPSTQVPTPDGEPGFVSDNAPIGEVITTDTEIEGGRLALWFSHLAQQDGKLAASMGIRTADGTLRTVGQAVDLDKSDLAPGFHMGYDAGPLLPELREYAVFGIVVGDVSKVTLAVDGEPKTAELATWSANPQVHVWWVVGPTLDRTPSKADPVKGVVTKLTAYGPDGKVVHTDSGEGDIAHG